MATVGLVKPTYFVVFYEKVKHTLLCTKKDTHVLDTLFDIIVSAFVIMPLLKFVTKQYHCL